MKKTRLILPLIFFILFAPVIAQAVETLPSAEKILSQLTDAMRSRSFRGVFTYEHGGSLETLDLTHVVEGGVEYERYVLLNGPEQSLSLGGRDSHCESVAGRLLRGAALSGSEDALHFHEYYQLYFKGFDRVAGRRVAVVQLLPKDDARYGLSIGVDVESGVLLKALIMSRKKVLERMQFVAFELDPALSGEEHDKVVNAGTRINGECKPLLSAQLSASDQSWYPEWVPKGFTLAAVKQTQQDGLVLTYTDGLSAFSLFANPDLVPSDNASAAVPRGVAQRGATLFVMDVQQLAGRFVHLTLVGEIPEASALRILRSVRSANPDAAKQK